VSAVAERPLPRPDLDSAPHFEAAAEGRLAVPQCGDCGVFHWYPSKSCPACGAFKISWPTLSGQGYLFSYTIVGHPVMPWLAGRVPYVLGLVELPDAPGVRLVTDVINVDPAEVYIGMPLRATFETLAEGLGLVHFEPT
jgi:hypothetical protein